MAAVTIDCGDLRDLVLWRVGGFRQEWFEEKEEKPLGRTVATKRVGSAVQQMVDQGCTLVTVQKLADDVA